MKKCDNWTVQMNIDLDERPQKERVEGRISDFDYPNGNFVLKNWTGWLLLLLFFLIIFLNFDALGLSWPNAV